ncbi:aquaporin-like protein [Rostrohypoxylon terebratum]|nr:aquaporin-like protein [Rostrohypoxylon terebratum]
MVLASAHESPGQYLSAKDVTELPTARLDPIKSNSNKSSKTRLSNTESHNQRIRYRNQVMPDYYEQPSPAVYIQKGYIAQNPWYGKPPPRPVFSLAKPFPRLVRWGKPSDGSTRRAPGSADELAELGQANISNTPEPMPDKEESSGEDTREDTRQDTREGIGEGVGEGTGGGTGEGTGGDTGGGIGEGIGEATSRQSRRTEAGHQPSNVRTHDTSEINEDNRCERCKNCRCTVDSEPLGQGEDDDEEQEDQTPETHNWWARIRAKHPEPLAEFLATLVAVSTGLTASLSVNLSAGQAIQYGTYETSCWAWGLAWMFGIYLGGTVSGAHMNPATSICLCLFRGFPIGLCCVYVFVQFAASIAASALAFSIHRDSIRYADPSMADTAKTFFSTPQPWVPISAAVLNQVIGGAFMMMVVFALGDNNNEPLGSGMNAFVFGLLITTLKFTLGFNVGSSLNPASDLASRIVLYAFGYRGPELFGTFWWWCGPGLATIAGSILGGLIYDVFIFIGIESPIVRKIPEGVTMRARKLFNTKTND